MSLPLIFSFSTTFLFGLLAIYISLKEEKIKKLLKAQQNLQRQKLYQIQVLKEIQDRIGYTLDIENVIDVITGSLRNLFPYSTASSMLVKDDTVVFKTYVEESVTRAFIEMVKKSMLASLSSLLQTIPATMTESLSGIVLSDVFVSRQNPTVASFFHIPLIVQGKVVGLINISSTKPNLYKESEMTILYQIVETASNALSRLQNVLQTEKGKLTAMISSLADGVFMIDTRDQLLVINDAAKKFMGITAQTISVIDIYGFFNPIYPLSEKIKQSAGQKQSIEKEEVTLNKTTLQVFIHPVFDQASGRVLGASVLLHDITLEKNLSLVKEDFTNMMVHELRAPLTAIKGAISLLKRNNTLTPQEEQRFLGVIENESSRLLIQISSLLDAAKVEAGKMTLFKKPTDINNLILEKVQMFQPQADQKHIVLQTHLDHSLPLISFDPLRIGEVVNNLLSNSLKYTSEGNVTVTTKKVNSEVNISVSDTGIGIPKEKQANLFSKFYQVASLNTLVPTHNISSGLGLYITKGIIDAHNGTISIDSDENKGTTFTIMLPIATTEQTQQTLPAPLPGKIPSPAPSALN